MTNKRFRFQIADGQFAIIPAIGVVWRGGYMRTYKFSVSLMIFNFQFVINFFKRR